VNRKELVSILVFRRGVHIILVLLLVFSYCIPSQQLDSPLEDSGSQTIALSTTEYTMVTILSDIAFVQQNWPGNGTEDSPFVIENLLLDPSELWPIRIENTRTHFIIRNCTNKRSIVGGVSDLRHTAISLRNVTNGVVVDCTLLTWETGFFVDNVNNSLMENNTIIDCNFPMRLGVVTNCSFSHNSISSEMEGTRHRFDAVWSYCAISCNISGNTISEADIGIVLEEESENNTLSMNRIGWCSTSTARDDGIRNMWVGNSWSDWDEIGFYLITGDSGSVDVSPTLFDEDVIGPTITFYHLYGIVADLLEPLELYTFTVNVSDISGVDSVILYIQDAEYTDEGLQIFWVPYEMNHDPVEGNPNRYTYTFDCDGSFNAVYHFFANDSLGIVRFSDIDSFYLGYMGWPGGFHPNPFFNAIIVMAIISLAAIAALTLYIRAKSE
jgi:parallel beta-helix repeat protein